MANFNSDNIQVFPAVNSRDNGKILLEENVSEIVTRITKLNFVYSGEHVINCFCSDSYDSNFTSFNLDNKYGEQDKDLKCNINGYDIIIKSGSGFSIRCSCSPRIDMVILAASQIR